MLLYLAWKQSLKKRSLLASGTVREHWFGEDADHMLEWPFVVAITLGAMYVAYTCNRRSGANNPYLMVLVAAVFPEVYLVQATIRALVHGSYSCAPRKGR